VPRSPIPHQHVYRTGQPSEDLPTCGKPRIESDAELVGVEEQKQAALFRMRNIAGEWRQPPGVVPLPRNLDVNDLGSQVGHELGAVRSADAAAVLQHSHAVQGFESHP
jgi:hypothetical protein